MLRKLFQTLLLLAFAGSVHAQPSGMTPLPGSLVQDGELIDAKSGFAIRVDQPNMTWSVVEGLAPNFSKYVGIDKQRKVTYSIFIDRRRYAEQSEERASKYAEGLKIGLQEGGWSITTSKILPSSIPRKNSYRFLNEATHSNGANATFVEYVTSPGNLYSIGATIPAGADERDFAAFLQTFRLLK